MSIKSQRRLASKILKVGANNVWINPERVEDVEGVITRQEIRRLIHEGVIKAAEKKGISRSRARLLHEKKKKGLRRGAGSRTGKSTARTPRKKSWEIRIRSFRARLRDLKARRVIREDAYRKLYVLAKGGSFSNLANLNQYIETRKLARRR